MKNVCQALKWLVLRHYFLPPYHEFMDCQVNPVEYPPDDKSPICPMSQATQDHGYH
jgi:hypothetical protein